MENETVRYIATFPNCSKVLLFLSVFVCFYLTSVSSEYEEPLLCGPLSYLRRKFIVFHKLSVKKDLKLVDICIYVEVIS